MNEIRSAFAPHELCILSVDPGATSGWAIYSRGRYVTSGTAKTHDERAAAVMLAGVEADRLGLRLVVVAEKWTGGGKRMHVTMVSGLGAAWGKWEAVLEAEEVPKSRVVRVYPQTWRARVLGASSSAGSEALKRHSLMAARIAKPGITDDNEADAIHIGQWSCFAPEVGKKAPKIRRRSK